MRNLNVVSTGSGVTTSEEVDLDFFGGEGGGLSAGGGGLGFGVEGESEFVEEGGEFVVGFLDVIADWHFERG